MSIEEILKDKGVTPKIVTESGSHFVVRFNEESEKAKAVKILTKLGYAITCESEEINCFKIVGIKKKVFLKGIIKRIIAQIETEGNE